MELILLLESALDCNFFIIFVACINNDKDNGRE